MTKPERSSGKDCFVLMPFKAPFDDYYKRVIVKAAKKAGLRPLRADEIFGVRPIMTDILEGIRNSDVVIAELTGRNPNVLYELGLTHGFGKRALILTQSLDDVPFDLKHIRCLVYDTSKIDWQEHLSARLVSTLAALLREPEPERPGGAPGEGAGDLGMLRHSFPRELQEQMSNASTILVVGVTLSRYVRDNYTALAERLQQGGAAVRFVMRDPRGETVSLIPRHSFEGISIEDAQAAINTTLSRLCSLRKIAPTCMDIRVLDHPFLLGGYAFDSDTPKGAIYIEYHPFLSNKGSIPKLVLHPADGEWYTFYRDQLEAFWGRGTSWKCPA